MPLKKCSINGKSGYKWGDQGKCYAGPSGKKKAIKQGLAENNGDSEKFKAEMSKGSVEDKKILQEVLDEAPDAAYAYVSKKVRDSMPLSDFGDPKNKKYPVKDKAHYVAALRLVGRAPKADQDRIRKRIERIGRRKGFAK